MTKRVLIIGTSHSEATCGMRQPDGSMPIKDLPVGSRWFDYFEKEYDVEITKLARGGCTVLDQYHILMCYLKDNPDAHWDVALIEGRGTEPSFDIPVPSRDKNSKKNLHLRRLDENRLYYDMWLDPEYREYEGGFEAVPWGRISPHDYDDEDINHNHDCDRHYLPALMAEYSLSDLHHMHTLAINHALCELVNTRATKTKWFTTYFRRFQYFDIVNKYLNTMGDFILDKEDFKNHPQTSLSHSTSLSRDQVAELKCDCGHMSEKGHQLFWELVIKPRVQKWFTDDRRSD